MDSLLRKLREWQAADKGRTVEVRLESVGIFVKLRHAYGEKVCHNQFALDWLSIRVAKFDELDWMLKKAVFDIEQWIKHNSIEGGFMERLLRKLCEWQVGAPGRTANIQLGKRSVWVWLIQEQDEKMYHSQFDLEWDVINVSGMAEMEYRLKSAVSDIERMVKQSALAGTVS